ncbi:NAD(P)-binding protein [Mycena metata]|uniref:NAD(P)-binding protein n=1 Tax=Mycena metata TaxID=1033252 RepID=A0AAD7HU12_9AGAR|nr:NAD(P)-binding protein [Mycena metata]
MLPTPTSPRSRGPSPGRPALSGSASFSPSGALDPADTHPVLHPGRVAVITGAASGIGAAAARLLASLHHMKIALADLPSTLPALEALAAELEEIVGEGNVLVVPTDVRVVSEVERLRERVYEAWSEVGVLMNNAGVNGGGKSWDGLDAWHDVFAVNLFGVVNVQQVFVPAMLHQENPAMVINTGSKQGITNPPGNTAYNASKAAVKSLTEGLAHQLRERNGGHGGGGGVTAHLFVPGWTFTGLTGQHDGGEKPPGAWTAEETVRYMLEHVAKGDFYVLCPDGDTGPEIDPLRIMWAAADVAQGRPALSRWHRDYKALFEEYMREGQALAQEGGLRL